MNDGEHPNQTLARELFAAFAARDVAAVGEAFAEDVVWRVGGSTPMAGEYRGRRRVLRFLASTRRLTAGTYRTELLYALADDDHLVMVYRARGQRGERLLDLVQLLLCEVRNGRIAEVTALPTDYDAFDDFWSDDTTSAAT